MEDKVYPAEYGPENETPTRYKLASSFAMYRGRKSTLLELDKVYDEHMLICEFEDDFFYDFHNRSQLYGKKCKYKLGDGVHKYSELPYEDGMIPVAFKVPELMY